MSSKKGSSVSLNMDSFKMFSREFTSQVSANIKELVSSAPKGPVKPVPNPSAVVNSGMSTELIAAIKNTNQYILDGYVITQSMKSDSIHFFLSEIEEFIIIYSTYYSNKANSVVNIKDLCSHLITVTANLCNIDITSPSNNVFLYSTNVISQIRLCLRLLASRDPIKLIVIVEQILVRFLLQEEFQMFKKLRGCLTIVNVSSLVMKDVSTVYFLPQFDDPFSSILHFHKFSQLSVNNSSVIRSTNPEDLSFGFQVVRCGSQQVHGVYTAALTNTDTNLMYVNNSGYIITRIKHTLVYGNQSKQQSTGSYYVWFIANPKLNSTYYHCCTTNDSTYPPSEGWLCYNSCVVHPGSTAGVGRTNADSSYCCGLLPPPVIQIVSVNKETDESKLPTAAGVVVVCPLPSHCFEPCEVITSDEAERPTCFVASTGGVKQRLQTIRAKRSTGSNRRIPNIMREEHECQLDVTPYRKKRTESDAYGDDVGLMLEEDSPKSQYEHFSFSTIEQSSCDGIADYWQQMQHTIQQTKLLIEKKKTWLSECDADRLLYGRPDDVPSVSTLDQVFPPLEYDDDTIAFNAAKDDYLEQNWNIDVLAQKYTAEAHKTKLHTVQPSLNSNNSSQNNLFGVNIAPLSNMLSPVKIKEEASQLIGFLKDGVNKVLSPPPVTEDAHKLTSRRSANMITLIDNMELNEGGKKKRGNQSALNDFLSDGTAAGRRKKDPNNPFEKDKQRERNSSISPKPSFVGAPASPASTSSNVTAGPIGSQLGDLELDLGTPYVFGSSTASARSADSLLSASTAVAPSVKSIKPVVAANSIFNSLPTFDTPSPTSSVLKFTPNVTPQTEQTKRVQNRTPPPQNRISLERAKQELLREDSSAEQVQYQQQIQHLNQLEEIQRLEDATSALSDLCEMTLPERFHNDFKTKISVLGVEMWKSGRKTAAVERLNYVLRIWLSDIKHTSTTSNGAVSPKDSQMPNSPGRMESNDSRGIVTLGAFTDRGDDSQNTLNTSLNDSAISILNGSNASIGELHSFKAGSNSSMLDLEFSESVQDEYSSIHTSERISLPSLPGIKVPAVEPPPAVKPMAPTPFSVFSKTVVERSLSSVADESWSVFTVRRDLPSLGALHAELTALLQGSDIEVPHFPDPFHIGTTEDDLIKNLFNSPAERKKLKYGTSPFLYNKNMRDPFDNASANPNGPGGLNNIDNVMSSVEQYLESVFQIVAFIDELASEESMHQPSSPYEVMNDDKYVFNSSDSGKISSAEMSESKRIFELSRKLGKLIGNFLHSTADNINDMLDSSSTNPSVTLLRNGNIEDDIVDVPQLDKNSSSYLPAISKRPCWYPYTNNGLKLRANFNVHKAMKSDVDLMRIQRSRCLGCSLPLITNLFGFDCNYVSCRYYGGLFCKRWCHNGELRAVPVRLLHYWDNKSYKICNQAVYFIDHISNKPLLNISTINPLLFEGVPLLRQIYRIRLQIAKLVESLVAVETNAVKQCIMTTIGKTKAHLCIANEIFSLHDVLNIHNGLLLINLQNLYNGLLVIKKNAKKAKDVKA